MNHGHDKFLEALGVDAASGRGDDDIEIYSIDLSGCFRRLTEPVQLIVVSRQQEQEPSDEGRRIINALKRNNSMARRPTVLVLPDQPWRIDPDLFPMIWIVLKPEDIRLIVDSGRPKTMLSRIIRRQVRLSELSPYTTNRIVTGRMFFGRETELRHVLQRPDENFVITGPRRIGKSSFAAELMRRAKDASNLLWPDLTLAHVDCNLLRGIDDEEELFRALLVSLRPDRRDEMYSRRRVGHRRVEVMSSFDYFATLVTKRYRSVLIVIDEIDGLIERDRAKSWKTLRRLQALVDTQKTGTPNRFRLVLVGFYNLQRALSDADFPLYGRLEEVILGPLDSRESAALVLEPLMELEIQVLNHAESVAKVFYYTGGFPILVQSFCRDALFVLEDHKKATLTPELVGEVLSNATDPNRSLAWLEVEASTLERRLVEMIAESDEIAIETLLDSCAPLLGESDRSATLARALELLVFSSILQIRRRPDGTRLYSIAIGALQGEILRRRQLGVRNAPSPATAGGVPKSLPRSERNTVFICYSHRDNDGRTRWLDKLREHLAPVEREAQIKVWTDRDIRLGSNWHEDIQAVLGQAIAAILIVSPSFLASEYIRSNELPVLLKRAWDDGMLIYSIVVRPCLFEEAHFRFPDPEAGPRTFSLASLQAANAPTRPLSGMSPVDQETTLLNVAKELLRAVRGSQGQETEPP